MSDARHHRAGRDTQIVLVPYPVYESGSPETLRQSKPPKYPRQGRDAWKPATTPPRRESKAQAVKRLYENIARQECDVRSYLDDMRRVSAERRREQAEARC